LNDQNKVSRYKNDKSLENKLKELKSLFDKDLIPETLYFKKINQLLE